MACGHMALALCAHSTCVLGGSEGMLPQEDFGFLDHLKVFLVHFQG